MYIYIYTNLSVNVIVRLPHHWSGDSQGQGTLLATYRRELLAPKK